LILKVRIDGGPVLRLLLDSGAQFIVLDKTAAARSGHSAGSELDLVGVGRRPKAARMAKAGSVGIGDLVFHDCELIVAEGRLLDGIDGVIPLSLFAGFLVRLDIPGKTLDLRPYPPGEPVGDGELSHVRASNNLLFIKAVLNEFREGYVLLDTGAFVNAISESTARALKYTPAFAFPVKLQSGAGATEGMMLPSELRFRFGSRVVKANSVAVVPLDDLEQHHGMAVAGSSATPRCANRFSPSTTGTVWSVSARSNAAPGRRTCRRFKATLPPMRPPPRVWGIPKRRHGRSSSSTGSRRVGRLPKNKP